MPHQAIVALKASMFQIFISQQSSSKLDHIRICVLNYGFTLYSITGNCIGILLCSRCLLNSHPTYYNFNMWWHFENTFVSEICFKLPGIT